MKPGLHKFVIFDPITETAWCKEIVIDLNNNYVECPELPAGDCGHNDNGTHNVWIPWKHDTADMIEEAVSWDSQSENYDPELLIRGKDSKEMITDEVTKIICNHFSTINIVQKECMANSSAFPEIDFKHFFNFISAAEDCYKAKIKNEESKLVETWG